MNRLFLQSLACFFILVGGFLCLALLFPEMPPMVSEAMFARAAQIQKAPFPLAAGLPLVLEDINPEKEAPLSSAPTPSSFSVYEAEPSISGDVLHIQNRTPYTVDTASLLSSPLTLKKGEPQVLIVHTHTSEAYAQSADFSYTPSDPYRTEDPTRNICLVGAALAESLSENGITAICDTTSHDYPSYSGCYNRSLATIEKNLAAHPSISVVIDLHRDAITGSDGNYLKTAATIDGESTAQVLVIVGTDAGGLSHPDWQKNLSLGLRVQKDLCTLYPGLARPLHLRTERFNGHVSPGALLVEIGSNANTMEEALRAARLFGRSLAHTLHSLAEG